MDINIDELVELYKIFVNEPTYYNYCKWKTAHKYLINTKIKKE